MEYITKNIWGIGRMCFILPFFDRHINLWLLLSSKAKSYKYEVAPVLSNSVLWQQWLEGNSVFLVEETVLSQQKREGGSRFDVIWKAFSKAHPEFSLFCMWLQARIWYKFFAQMPRSPELPLHQPSWSPGPWGPGKWKIKMWDTVGPEIHQLLNLLDRDFLS